MTELDLSGAYERFTSVREAAEIKLNAVKAEISAAGRTVIAEAAKAFFDRNPTVHGFRWTQYTPSFNDGDALEFQVHEPDLEISPIDDRNGSGHHYLPRRRAYYLSEIEKARASMQSPDDGSAGQRGYLRKYSQSDIDRANAEIASIDALTAKAGGSEAYESIIADFTVVSRLIKGLNRSDLELIFGDHCQVLVTRDGVEVEVYEHD